MTTSWPTRLFRGFITWRVLLLSGCVSYELCLKFVVCLARSVYSRVLGVRGGNKVQEEEGKGSRVKERKGEKRVSVFKAEQGSRNQKETCMQGTEGFECVSRGR